jgi:serine/threonine protein phosphatase PrpC
VLGDTDSLEAKAGTLVEWANRHGGRDNVTVLLAGILETAVKP